VLLSCVPAKTHKQMYRIRVTNSDQVCVCEQDQPVLLALQRAGSAAIPIGCRGGGCGVCRVQVLSGAYALRPMSRRHISDEDIAQGIVLACCLLPRTDLVVAVAARERRPEVCSPDQGCS